VIQLFAVEGGENFAQYLVISQWSLKIYLMFICILCEKMGEAKIETLSGHVILCPKICLCEAHDVTFDNVLTCCQLNHPVSLL